jgi:hypothetical protein
MTLHDLDLIVAILSGDLQVKMVPGDCWSADRTTRRIVYPRDHLLTMPEDEAVGWVFRCVEHCISSFGDLDAYNIGVDVALSVREQAGLELIHPRCFLKIVFAAERERVEAIARRASANLEHTYLPRRWHAYRAGEEQSDRATLARVSQPNNVEDYWDRCALALALVACNALAANDLPADMRWTHETIALIQALPHIASYDELLTEAEHLTLAFARAQMEALASPADAAATASSETSENDSDKDASNGASTDTNHSENADESPAPDQGDADGGEDGATSADSTSSEATDAESCGEGPGEASKGEAGTGDTEASDDERAGRSGAGEKPKPSSAPQANAQGSAGTAPSSSSSVPETLAELAKRIPVDIRNTIQSAVDEIPDDIVEIDFLNDSAAATPGHEPTTYATNHDRHGAVVPAWGAVSRSQLGRTLREPLRRTLLAHLVKNEVGDLETGFRGGRLNLRSIARPDPDPRPFMRRRQPTEQSYAVALILDASGSMSADVAEIGHDETLFGAGYPQRWHLTTYLAVAFAEAFNAIPNTQITIVTYDSDVTYVKSHKMPLTPTAQQNILANIPANGNNDDAGALDAAITDLASASNTTKFIFHLTDGEFISHRSAIQYQIDRAKRLGITVVFLTLAIEPTSARRFVAHDLADRVDPATLGPVIGKHIARMLRVGAAA